ncbi:putative oxidoreductase protein [Phaeoacremonium minimum UCRPA7]|uniref:Putative oxidoreductase protein n=1 Tax=Phaeoacremonium minimum (strain UCR-PA7) TaxID=1286976 RepID=R8BJK3_PHAM7|nr:putative oxidoreductase protein [Phaeoacremonium minimum UCRPA7]EON99505.1 putative oxidoreductase protein [Phaeoacremonium minimum UCRPA7]
MPDYATINLHPATHAPSSLKTTIYDAISIGSGWAGRTFAAHIVKAGLSAIVIEDELVGGECPFWACVPSKALLRPQEALDEALAVGGARERTTGDRRVDVAAVLRRRDEYAGVWDDTKLAVPIVEGSGTTIVRGEGRIVGVKKVSVRNVNGEEVTLEARHAVAVCTGSALYIPDIAGLAEAKPWTVRHAISSSVVPETLVIVGAGPIGAEMATVYANLGSKVTLVTPKAEILDKIDAEAGATVRRRLESRGGANVLVSTAVTSAERQPDGFVTVGLSNGKSLRAHEILIASGRKSCTTGMGLEQFGIKTDGSPIKVDESLRVPSVEGGWLYALGDVNGRAPTSHTSKYHGRIASNVVLASIRGLEVTPSPWSAYAATADVEAAPQVIFTSPNVASVGLTRTKAQVAGRPIREVIAPLITLGARIYAEGYEDGWAQWILDRETGRLLGATFVGDYAAELLHASTVAIAGGMTLERLLHALPPFPTMSEVYLNLLDAAEA